MNCMQLVQCENALVMCEICAIGAMSVVHARALGV